jgi:hypothetical protein
MKYNIKNLSLTVLLGAMGVSFSGCDSLLDLEPQQSISDDVALSTPSNVRAALVGAYAQMGNYYLYGGGIHFMSELLAADPTEIIWDGTFLQPRQIYQKNIATDNSFVQFQWTNAYNTINRTNNVLSALSVFGDNVALANRTEGEAKFIRASIYFELVRVFGKSYNDGDPNVNLGVPLVLSPTRGIDASSEVSRATVKAAYDQIIADLLDAKAKLPPTNGFFANTYAASAMLSRVYLMTGNWAGAETEAGIVIASNKYALESNVASNFNQTSNGSEIIFAMQVTSQDGINSNQVFFASENNSGRSDITMSASHFNRYEAGDERATLFYFSTECAGTPCHTSKWRDLPRNVGVIRFAEMYLTRAEALVRQSQSGDAAVNIVRARAGLAGLTSATLAQILNERSVEFQFEGLTLHDLKRNGTDIVGRPFSDHKLVYPIPFREMEVNSNLVQNPSYQ